jgi:hypothetical protein
MTTQVEIDNILQMSNKAIEDIDNYPIKRDIYSQIETRLNQKIFIGINGLRGVGKSTLLRQLCKNHDKSIYISSDALIGSTRLFDIAKTLEQNHAIKYLMIDEIHYLPKWQKELKNIFDFLKIQVIFTSSSSLSITRSKYDLSRRVVIISMLPFSFGEYLHFSTNQRQPILTLDEILKNPDKNYSKIKMYETMFEPFCSGYALPAYLQAPQPQTIVNILEKIVQHDLISIARLNQKDISDIMQLLRFSAMSGIEGVSYSSISSNCAIAKHKVINYVELLQKAFVLQVIMPKGTNVLKEPKILIALPFRVHLAPSIQKDRLIGSMREEFFIHHMQDRQIFYLKSQRGEKLADYLIVHNSQKIVFEVGGANKTQTQFKGVEADRKFVLTQPANLQKGIPLILFGFLAQNED